MGLLDTLLRRAVRPRARLSAVGEPAPAFDVRDQEGARVTLEDLAGRRFVLWFYPRADTPG